MSKQATSARATLHGDAAQLEQLASQVATLRAMSDEDLLTDEELERFFAMILPAQRVALASESEKVGGRVLTSAEIQTVSVAAFVTAAGDAAREIWGATIAELIDGKKPQ